MSTILKDFKEEVRLLSYCGELYNKKLYDNPTKSGRTLTFKNPNTNTLKLLTKEKLDIIMSKMNLRYISKKDQAPLIIDRVEVRKGKGNKKNLYLYIEENKNSQITDAPAKTPLKSPGVTTTLTGEESDVRMRSNNTKTFKGNVEIEETSTIKVEEFIENNLGRFAILRDGKPIYLNVVLGNDLITNIYIDRPDGGMSNKFFEEFNTILKTIDLKINQVSWEVIKDYERLVITSKPLEK